MSKLRLKLKSPVCNDPAGDIYAMVDVTLNGETLQENLQLGATETTHTWDGTVNTGSDNTVVVTVTNSVAEDLNGDGEFGGTGENVIATVTGIEYSTDDTNYTSVLPQAEVIDTISGGANDGTSATFKPALTELIAYESLTVKFNTTDGLVNSDDVTAVLISESDGTYYDKDGNALDN